MPTRGEVLVWTTTERILAKALTTPASVHVQLHLVQGKTERLQHPFTDISYALRIGPFPVQVHLSLQQLYEARTTHQFSHFKDAIPEA